VVQESDEDYLSKTSYETSCNL